MLKFLLESGADLYAINSVSNFAVNIYRRIQILMGSKFTDFSKDYPKQ